ncbi:MAG TPA: C40 family peptidase [Phycisphaerae bacterium]|mgnify:CR=1 FL=1|nr:C40 family peptidase [Phycisphaerae bacterium]
MDLSADINAAIERFEPSWRPAPDALAERVIAIRPTGGGAGDTAAQAGDDLALQTAAILFHYVQWAGGTPVMTRADDKPERIEVLAPHISADAIVVLTGTCTATEPGANGSVPARTVIRGCGPLVQAIRRAFELSESADADMSAADARRVEIELHIAPGNQPDSATLPRTLARRICTGLIDHAQALPAQPAGDAGKAHGSTAPVPRFFDRSDEAQITATAQRIWPDGDLPMERAAWFCDMWCSVALSDQGFVYFRPRVEREGDGLVIRGATNVACMRDTLATALRVLGVAAVRSDMRLVPEDRPEGAERFGACVVTTALTYAEPSEASGLRTQLTYGEPVFILDGTTDFLLVHASDGYWGWVRRACIRTMDEAAFTAYTSAKRAILVEDVAVDGLRILRGAVLPFEFSVSGRVALSGPDGERWEVSAHTVRAFDTRADAAERIERALALLHTPYVFGGVSPLGLDCSGLMQMLTRQTGVPLPRDAAQQFLTGRLVAPRWHRAAIAPGDVLFFINACGRIFHVGLALTADHFVHSGPPEVKIDSLNPGDRLYAPGRERTFLAARRL